MGLNTLVLNVDTMIEDKKRFWHNLSDLFEILEDTFKKIDATAAQNKWVPLYSFRKKNISSEKLNDRMFFINTLFNKSEIAQSLTVQFIKFPIAPFFSLDARKINRFAIQEKYRLPMYMAVIPEYRHDTGIIKVPHSIYFRTREGFALTLAHELAHSTKRFITRDDITREQEEFLAELIAFCVALQFFPKRGALLNSIFYLYCYKEALHFFREREDIVNKTLDCFFKYYMQGNYSSIKHSKN
jgi:hypothetical protein